MHARRTSLHRGGLRPRLVLLLHLMLALFLAPAANGQAAQDDLAPQRDYLVKLEDGADTARVAELRVPLHAAAGASVVLSFRFIPGWQLVSFREPVTLPEARRRYERSLRSTLAARPGIAASGAIRVIVEPDGLIGLPENETDGEAESDERRAGHAPAQARARPNDPSFKDLWALENTGQRGICPVTTTPRPGADISAVAAWDINTGGDSGVVVAVIDDGVQVSHPDLADNMWRNPLEVPNNRLDDDGNGVIDDVHGFIAGTTSGSPAAGGHGTHVAGTVGAVGNNGKGVVGVNWKTKIMVIDIFSGGRNAARRAGEPILSTVSRALSAWDYVLTMKARGVNVRVTNNSWINLGELSNGTIVSCGPATFFRSQKEAIERLGREGIVSVFAAGNSSRNNDLCPTHPASYDSPTIISVAASNEADGKAGFSNWGATTVDLAAPGTSIYSTVPGNRYGCKGGTSMASPHVAGAVALVASRNNALSADGLKDAVLRGVDPLPPAWATTRVLTGGRLNLLRALQVAGGSSGGGGGRPAARKILFMSTRDGNPEIYAADVDGSGLVRLTNHPASDHSPSWSPDGTRIVFVSEREGGNPEIYVMNADGSNLVRVTNHPAADGHPAW